MIPAMFTQWVKIGLVIGSMIIIMSSACSNKVLKVFFDGVPGAADSAAMNHTTADSKPGRIIVTDSRPVDSTLKGSVHLPYQNKKCSLCHDQEVISKILKPQPQLCYNCHDDFSSYYKVVHLPVANGKCTICHTPHRSDQKKLLKQPTAELCIACHDDPDLLTTAAHAGSPGAECTNCHNPHGGEDKRLMK